MTETSQQIITDAVAQAHDTRVVEVGRDVLEHGGQIITDALGLDQTFQLIADERTWAVAGQQVQDQLSTAGADVVPPLIYPAMPYLYASYDHCQEIRESLAAHEALGVAIGSGTLNDLVKLASGELEQPYAVVGTAASMDGYTGFGAPMEADGVKITMPCPAPAVVIFDLEVAASAPKSMTASGYGDLSAKIPAGADWILADAAGVDPIDQEAWRLVQTGVRDALSQPQRLAAGSPDAYQGLVDGLVLSGLAMQVNGGTRPASGAEHYFSHLWELAHLGADLQPPLSHGAKVAIGTLAMLGFYERFMARDLGSLDIDAAVAAWPSWDEVVADIERVSTGALVQRGIEQTKEKYVDAEGLRQRLQRLVDAWPATRRRLEEQLVPAAELQDMLARAGAPSRPEDIGLTAAEVKATFPKAMYYRSRYTVLDVAREAGWFGQIVEETFAPGGLWS